jgi:hypothetical protein
MPKVAAVVDTNAMMDLVSCHDVIDALKKSERDAWFRFGRAAYALRMAIHFHETRAITFSAGREALDITVYRVPPDVNDIKTWYVRAWFQFVQPKLLHQWTIKPAAISGKGNEVDDGLVELARQLGCLLISNEGIGPGGPNGNKDGIRAKAALASVRVMTTEEFCRSSRLSRTRVKRYVRAFRTPTCSGRQLTMSEPRPLLLHAAQRIPPNHVDAVRYDAALCMSVAVGSGTPVHELINAPHAEGTKRTFVNRETTDEA